MKNFVLCTSYFVLAASAVFAADIAAVTNLTTCPQNVRNEFKAALKSAVAAGDMATF